MEERMPLSNTFRICKLTVRENKYHICILRLKKCMYALIRFVVLLSLVDKFCGKCLSWIISVLVGN